MNSMVKLSEAQFQKNYLEYPVAEIPRVLKVESFNSLPSSLSQSRP